MKLRVRGFKKIAPRILVIFGKGLDGVTDATKVVISKNNDDGNTLGALILGDNIMFRRRRVLVVQFADDLPRHVGSFKADPINPAQDLTEIEVTVTNDDETDSDSHTEDAAA